MIQRLDARSGSLADGGLSRVQLDWWRVWDIAARKPVDTDYGVKIPQSLNCLYV